MSNHAVGGRWVSSETTAIEDGLCPVYIRNDSSQFVEGRECKSLLPFDCEKGNKINQQQQKQGRDIYTLVQPMGVKRPCPPVHRNNIWRYDIVRYTMSM